MTDIPVEFKRDITQLVPDRKYKGSIAYEGTKLDFIIEFSEGVDSLQTKRLKDVTQARLVFPLALARDGERIELTDDEYPVWFMLFASFAWDFAKHPQTVESNHGIAAKLLEAAQLGSISYAMSATHTLVVSSDVYRILSAPKYFKARR